MSKDKVVRPEDRTFKTLFERAQKSPALDAAMRKFDEQEWYTASFEDFPGSATEGQFYMVWIPPNTVIAPHAPIDVETFNYILWGELHYKGDVYGVGTSVRWPSKDEDDEWQTWSAGPMGLMRVVARPRRPSELGSSVHGGPPEE